MEHSRFDSVTGICSVVRSTHSSLENKMSMRYSMLYRCWIVRAPWIADIYNRNHMPFDSRTEASAWMQRHDGVMAA